MRILVVDVVNDKGGVTGCEGDCGRAFWGEEPVEPEALTGSTGCGQASYFTGTLTDCAFAAAGFGTVTSSTPLS
jgi:hypothetical protein